MSRSPRESSELYISRNEIASICKTLGTKISHDYKNKDLVMICVLKGTILFFADLVRQISIPFKMDFVRLASYGTGTESSGQIRIIKDVSLNLQGQEVIVVEDILDTGNTLTFFKKHLETFKPASVKICTLLDKPSRRQKPIEADYCGKQIPDAFVVGYGLDIAEKCRNYPDIYKYSPPS